MFYETHKNQRFTFNNIFKVVEILKKKKVNTDISDKISDPVKKSFIKYIALYLFKLSEV